MAMSQAGELYQRCIALGLILAVDKDGDLQIRGDTRHVDRLMPGLREHHDALVRLTQMWEDAQPGRH